jgi:hypothetical protein
MIGVCINCRAVFKVRTGGQGSFHSKNWLISLGIWTLGSQLSEIQRLGFEFGLIQCVS